MQAPSRPPPPPTSPPLLAIRRRGGTVRLRPRSPRSSRNAIHRPTRPPSVARRRRRVTCEGSSIVGRPKRYADVPSAASRTVPARRVQRRVLQRTHHGPTCRNDRAGKHIRSDHPGNHCQRHRLASLGSGLPTTIPRRSKPHRAVVPDHVGPSPLPAPGEPPAPTPRGDHRDRCHRGDPVSGGDLAGAAAVRPGRVRGVDPDRGRVRGRCNPSPPRRIPPDDSAQPP